MTCAVYAVEFERPSNVAAYLSKAQIVLYKGLTPNRKNNRGIFGVERFRTPVTGFFIVGLQHH